MLTYLGSFTLRFSDGSVNNHTVPPSAIKYNSLKIALLYHSGRFLKQKLYQFVCFISVHNQKNNISTNLLHHYISSFQKGSIA